MPSHVRGRHLLRAVPESRALVTIVPQCRLIRVAGIHAVRLLVARWSFNPLGTRISSGRSPELSDA